MAEEGLKARIAPNNKELQQAPQEVATRQAFGEALAELGAKHPEIIVLDADLSESTKTNIFAKSFPKRFFNIGISEQDMIGTAAGLASCGKTVFACSFAVFSTGRCFDQIRNSVAYSNTNVKIVGTHAGLATGADGYSHQALEDIALMRSLPNMIVLSPCDAVETKKAVEFCVQAKKPVYLRLCREKSPVLLGSDYKFELGKGTVLRQGSDAAIVATGVSCAEALVAAQSLGQKGVSCAVLNMPSLKPFDKELLFGTARQVKAIVSVEDHSVNGGLGSIVAEALAENDCAVKFARLGVQDIFGESGSKKELFKKFGIDAEAIEKKILELVR